MLIVMVLSIGMCILIWSMGWQCDSSHSELPVLEKLKETLSQPHNKHEKDKE